MSRGTQLALALAVAALALGVVGDLLFHGEPLGVNVLVWTVGFVLALCVLLGLARAPLHQGRRFMVAPLLVFAAMFAWHDSPFLAAANLFAIAAAVTMGALRRTQPQLRDASLTDYGRGAVAAGASTLAGAVPLLMTDIRWSELSRPRAVGTVARGLAIATPLLLLFGGLFVAADVVFKQLLTAALPTVSGSLFGRVALAALIAWLAGGLLRDLLAPSEDRRLVRAEAARAERTARLGAAELNTALGLLVLLFLAFVVVQFRYLFGGSDLVHETAGLTYAEYARKGFFELVAVVVLTLPVLLLGDWLLRDKGRGRRIFRLLAGAMLGLLGVVIASALQRLWLYQEEYGLTESRVYAAAVVLWLAVVCAWFAVTVLRGRRHLFAVGTLVGAFAATLALNVINPDALIARTNVTRPSVDVVYLTKLSDDAVPTLAARIGSLPPAQQSILAGALLVRSSSGDWRSWNVSRSRADRALREHRSELERLAQPAKP